MDEKLAVVSGVGLGVGLMFLFDPEKGQERRSVVGSSLRSYADRTVEAARTRLRPGGVPDDEVLAARVRAKLDRCVSHPRAIHVFARDGRVTLSGAVLGFELDELLRAVGRVRGVREVENHLDLHGEPDAAPLMEADEDGEEAPSRWSRPARVLAGAAGGGLALYGLKRRDAVGAALGTLGLGLIIRGLADVDLGGVLGLGGDGSREVHRTIHVSAPVERVFELWSDYQNFPRFLSRVREVLDLGQGRSHWVAEGSLGMPVEWDAVLIAYEPNERIGWQSLPGASSPNVGSVRFTPDAEGGTRVEMFLAHEATDDGAGLLWGADPLRQLDDDLLRMKAFVEGRVAGRDVPWPDALGQTTSPGTLERPVEPGL